MEPETNKISQKQSEPEPGVLYVVATPIGNLGDLSPRAKNILSSVSVIACEDTRHSSKLLKAIKVKAKLISFHKHNTKARVPKLISFLTNGASIALISDSGLPGISDPGEELILTAKEIGHEVICIPGACAAITALVSSGLPSQRFCFEGFLPSKSKDRESILNIISQEKRTTIIYESPHKLLKLLQDLSNVCEKNRPLQVARELTKIHEEHIGKTIDDVIKYFSKNQPKGEFTLILGGAPPSTLKEFREKEILESMDKLRAKGLSTKNAAYELSIKTGFSKNLIYSLFHQKTGYSQKKDAK